MSLARNELSHTSAMPIIFSTDLKAVLSNGSIVFICAPAKASPAALSIVTFEIPVIAEMTGLSAALLTPFNGFVPLPVS